MSTAAAIQEPIPDRSDVQKYIRFAVLDRVAHVGIMLDKMQRGIRRAEGYEMLAATGDMKYLEAAHEEDMSVNIGNETHYHYSAPAPAEPAAAPPVTTPDAPPAETDEDGDDDTEPPSNPPTDNTTDSSTSTNTSTSTTTIERIGNGLRSFVVPVLLGAGLLGAGAAGMALYSYATDKPDSVTTITQPSGRFEYRYGIEQRPTPTQ